MAKVVRVEAVITAQEELKPGLEAAARELGRFRDRQSKVSKSMIRDADRTRMAYADVAAKLASVNAAVQNAGQKRGLTQMAGHISAIRRDLAQAQKIDAFRTVSRRLDEAAIAMKSARQEAARAKSALGTDPKAIGENERARAAVERATAAFRQQGNAVRQARADLAEAGIAVKSLAASEAMLKRNIEAATGAMNKQAVAQARSAARREGLSTIAGVAGVSAAVSGKNLANKAVVSIADFDIAVRKQREFTDISEADQARLLTPQAKRIGQETQFTNLDIVKAQTAAMQGLPSSITGTLKAEVAQGLIENAKHYALIMESGMTTAAEAMRSYLQTTGQDISTKEKALAAANKATNQLVRMAKLGGMNDDDVQQYLKFAASSGTAAGLTPESLMSIAALARRGGLRGDEAGVFMRATASKLVSPTKKGIAGLNAAGIRHSDYVRMPASLDVDGLEGQFKNAMGIGFTDATRAALAKILSDTKTLGDQGSFVEAVTGAVEGQFPKTKKGTMRPADRINVAKAAGTFYQNSASSVDAEGLLDRIMSSSMTLAQLNAILTDKHGGKGAITQRQREEYVSARQQLRDAGNDPNYAKRKADEIMAGVGGSFEQAKGAVDNFVLSLGEANAGLIKLGADGFSGALGMFDKLSKGGQQVVSAFGAIAALGGGLWGTAKLFGLLSGGTSAAALTGSATALTGSAAALNAAAVALSTASGAKVAAPAVGAAAGSLGPAAASGSLPLIARLGLLGGAGLVIGGAAAGISVIGEANREKYKGVEPGEVHNEGRNRRKAYHEALRAETQGVRQEVEKLGPAGDGAGSDLAAGIEAGMERAKASVRSAVQEMQRSLNSLQMPNISNNGSRSHGFNTGKQGPN